MLADFDIIDEYPEVLPPTTVAIDRGGISEDLFCKLPIPIQYMRNQLPQYDYASNEPQEDGIQKVKAAIPFIDGSVYEGEIISGSKPQI